MGEEGQVTTSTGNAEVIMPQFKERCTRAHLLLLPSLLSSGFVRVCTDFSKEHSKSGLAEDLLALSVRSITVSPGQEWAVNVAKSAYGLFKESYYLAFSKGELTFKEMYCISVHRIQ